MCTWDRIVKGALKIRVYWERVLYVFKSPIKIEKGVSLLYHVPFMWPSVGSLESLLCAGFSGLLWGLFKELSRVKLIPREGGAGLGNVL